MQPDAEDGRNMATKMKTAKALGFGLGQLVSTGLYPAVIISDVNTATPMCEVWGVEQESGSVYAHDLRLITTAEFEKAVQLCGHTLPLKPWSERALLGLQAAGIPCEER
jgi:hypothetical protein